MLTPELAATVGEALAGLIDAERAWEAAWQRKTLQRLSTGPQRANAKEDEDEQRED